MAPIYVSLQWKDERSFSYVKISQVKWASEVDELNLESEIGKLYPVEYEPGQIQDAEILAFGKKYQVIS